MSQPDRNLCPACGSGSLERVASHEDPATRGTFTLWNCAGCGLQHWSPLQHPEGAYYSAAGGIYSEFHTGERDGTRDPRFTRFLDDFGSASDRRLLDVGCSDGALVELFEKRGNRAVGIDIDERAVEVGRRKGLDTRVETLSDFVHGAPGLFDFVTFFDVLEHVTDPLAVLANVTRLLSPDGKFVGTVPNRDRVFANLVDTDFPPHHFFRFDQASLSRLLQLAGFRVERVEVFQFGYAGGALAAHLVRRIRGRTANLSLGAQGSAPAAPPARPARSARPGGSLKHKLARGLSTGMNALSQPVEERLGKGFKLYFVASVPQRS